MQPDDDAVRGGKPVARDPRPPDPADAAPINSETLLAGQRERIIRHGAEKYRLRLTGNNKLILTK